MLFTQNIDCLERQAGVPDELIVEAHGSFATQRCIECKKEFPDDVMKEHVFKGQVPRCADKDCDGLVKPDIVFFGEALPKSFYDNRHVPGQADMAFIMGTSLTVHPFAGLPDLVNETCPRVLFNMERVGSLGSQADDVLVLGDCDSGVRKLAEELGWAEELEEEWRRVVGEKEAARQLRSAEYRQTELHDEVEDLAEKVGAGLKLDQGSDDHEGEAAAGNAAQKAKEPSSSSAAAEPTKVATEEISPEEAPKALSSPPASTVVEVAKTATTNVDKEAAVAVTSDTPSGKAAARNPVIETDEFKPSQEHTDGSSKTESVGKPAL